MFDLQLSVDSLSPRNELSRRAGRVVEVATLGRISPEVAGPLEVGTSTVKSHLASVYRKLGVSNRTEAAVAYVSGNRGG